MAVKQRTGAGKQLRRSAIVQRTLDQLVGTVANPGPHHGLVGLGQPEFGQRTIDRQRQLRGTVDQGAVQIEQHQIKITFSV